MKIKRVLFCGVAGLLFFANGAPAQDGDEDVLRVLMVTGRDVPVHKWYETTPVLRGHLDKTKKFEVVVSEEPLVLESSALDGYDAVVFNYYNWKRPSISLKAKDNLLSFVKSGKGLVSFHFSVRAFDDWSEYGNLVGRIWTKGSGHGPRGEFAVKVAQKDHFITQGISDFQADDELYAKLVGDAPINVLVEAYSDWSHKTEPIAWTLPYGKGRVFNIVLGHDARACKNKAFAKLFQRGVEWAARKNGN